MITSISPITPNSLACHFPKCARVGVALFVALFGAACSTGSTQSAQTDQNVTTLPAVSAFDAASTSESIWSRETREAILRCIDQLDGSFAFLVALDAEHGDTTELDQAITVCDEAELQTEVDGSGRLDLAFRELFLKLRAESVFIGLAALGGDVYVVDEVVLQATVDLFVQRATNALDE